jgi:hypothetical protein
MALSQAGYMCAGMGRALPEDAPDDFRRGYFSYRPSDGERFGKTPEEAEQDVRRQMYADGLLPERRQTIQSDAHRVAMPRWEFGMWLVVALVAGLAAPAFIAGLSALGGAA